MTLDQLIIVFEKYYGIYENEYVKNSVISYIRKDHKEDMYPEIKRAILYHHQSNYSAPCIAVIEKALKNARLEKGLIDTHKTKTTNTDRYNYKKEYEEGNEEFKPVGSLVEELNKKIKRV